MSSTFLRKKCLTQPPAATCIHICRRGTLEGGKQLCDRERSPGIQGDGVWTRPSVYVMAIGDCSVHSFLVIEMPALQPAHLFETSAWYNLLPCTHLSKRDGREGSNVVVIDSGQHSRHSTRRAFRPLRHGCRRLFIVIEMRGLSPAHSWSNCVLQRAAASV